MKNYMLCDKTIFEKQLWNEDICRESKAELAIKNYSIKDILKNVIQLEEKHTNLSQDIMHKKKNEMWSM